MFSFYLLKKLTLVNSKIRQNLPNNNEIHVYHAAPKDDVDTWL